MIHYSRFVCQYLYLNTTKINVLASTAGLLLYTFIICICPAHHICGPKQMQVLYRIKLRSWQEQIQNTRITETHSYQKSQSLPVAYQ